MLNSIDFSGRPFHFIGIGGIGMSALAYVLTERKLPVSGSDICLNHITQRLRDLGAHIFLTQEATNLEFFKTTCTDWVETGITTNGKRQPLAEADGSTPEQVQGEGLPQYLPQVICSTAINTINPEYRAALQLGCPVFHRSDVLAALMQEHQGIAVAGTHGKTTTSSMIGYLLYRAGLDPTVVIGGEVDALGGNARVGQSPYLVAEADESDGSLIKLAAHIGVITNIELDHPDHYSSLNEVIEIFKTFATQCKTLVACADCPTLNTVIEPDVSYSVRPGSDADYTVDQVVYHADGTTAEVWERGQRLGQLNLKLLGQHNLSNALAAIAVGRLVGIEFDEMAAILAEFEGARRRFEHKGEHNHILFVDDYAHHPSELQATLAAARLQRNSETGQLRRVVAIFQPHRYSRTKAFLEDFARSFNDADVVITTEIYGASEANSGQTSGQHLADAIARYHSDVVFRPTLSEVSAYLMETLMPGDLALFLGAGNLNRIIPDLTAYFEKIEQANSGKWCNSAR